MLLHALAPFDGSTREARKLVDISPRACLMPAGSFADRISRPGKSIESKMEFSISFLGIKMKNPLDLNTLMLFHEVVRTGSLAGASQRLGMPRSTLSRRLGQLEKEMGALLLKKSTRKLAATDIGLSLYEHCERIASEAAEVREKASRMQTELHGTLRVALPIEFGTAWLGKAVSEFAIRHPDMHIEIDVSGRVVDLIDESVDIAIAFGQPKESRLAQRRLGSISSGIYASPAYLERRGAPQALGDILAHDCVVTEIQQREGVWLVRSQNTRRSVRVNGRVRVNSIRLARELVIGGTGLGLLPHMMCANYLASSRLVRVLPSWNSPTLPVVALFLSRHRVPKRTRVFLDFVAEQLTLQQAPA
ncbi:LysR family transcriptional regulator [Noviherbaspirillum pedocola]|uniref:LysR family transcriptional regulator n=1 Tax=Noviherbaspirillum pedocola TaxID=2801341 RepID=A0A934SZE9_9BURK|nr:LysR family transcriptional regulator [Noviherbaspirillum pedocola]MBK4738532.1 LysR family transcriptional regulator [Noviherbaspirillum pedocola]